MVPVICCAITDVVIETHTNKTASPMALHPGELLHPDLENPVFIGPLLFPGGVQTSWMPFGCHFVFRPPPVLIPNVRSRLRACSINFS
jgi:hypothetical protein